MIKQAGNRLFNQDRGYVFSLFTRLRVKLHFERDIIFAISRSEIAKMMSLSKKYFAACGGKIFFAPPPAFDYRQRR